jgi:hypothetical protein
MFILDLYWEDVSALNAARRIIQANSGEEVDMIDWLYTWRIEQLQKKESIEGYHD